MRLCIFVTDKTSIIVSPILNLGQNPPFLAQFRLKRAFFEINRRNKAEKWSKYEEIVFLTNIDIPVTKIKSTITSPTLNLAPNSPFLAKFRLKRAFFEINRWNKDEKSCKYGDIVFLRNSDVCGTDIRSSITGSMLYLGPNSRFWAHIRLNLVEIWHTFCAFLTLDLIGIIFCPWQI